MRITTDVMQTRKRLDPKLTTEKAVSIAGMPSNSDLERLTLGAAMVNSDHLKTISGSLTIDDFSVESHRIIFRRILDMAELGDEIDRMTLAQSLIHHHEMEAAGGIGYLTSLDEGLPQVPVIAGYVKILRDLSAKRSIIISAHKASAELTLGEDDTSKVLTTLREACDSIEVSLGQSRKLRTFEDHLEAFDGDDELFVNPAMGDPGMPTGFNLLDDLINGLHGGRVYVIGGDSSTGKSALASNIAENIAESAGPVLYFSLEMGWDEIGRRIVSARSGVPMSAMYRRRMNDMDRYRAVAKLAELRKLPFYVDDTGSLTIADFLGRALRAIREKHIRAVFVDYLQLIDWQTPRGNMSFRDQGEALTYFTRVFKLFARSEKIAVVLVSQFNRARARREKKDRLPRLSDFHGSSSIEKDSDVCILIHRPEVDDRSDMSLKGKAEIVVAKNRNGPQGTVKMLFHGTRTRFEETDQTDEG